VASLPVAALGDTVTLKNDATYVGRIVSQDDKSVTISAEGARWTFPRDRIRSIVKDAAEAARAERNEQQHTAEMKKRHRQAHPVTEKTSQKSSEVRHLHGGLQHGAGFNASRPAVSSESDKMRRLEQLTHQPTSLSQ
jgi:hypothetical protein